MNTKALSHNQRNAEILPASEEFPLVASRQAMGKVLQLIDENLGQQKVSPYQLPRVKLTRDAGFQVETAGGMEPASRVTGVITAFRLVRAFYNKPYSGGKDRPTCSSIDGFTGVGDPGGSCAECPLSQFKSARNPDGSQGAGQACREMRQLLLLLPGNILPHRLDIPPTSVANFQKYSLNLVYSGASYWTVVTKLTAEMAPTQSGIPVARINFLLYNRLDKDQTETMEPYHDRMRNFLTPMTLDVSSYEVIEQEPASASAAPAAAETSPDDIPF